MLTCHRHVQAVSEISGSLGLKQALAALKLRYIGELPASLTDKSDPSVTLRGTNLAVRTSLIYCAVPWDPIYLLSGVLS